MTIRLHSAPAERNKEPLLQELREVFANATRVLEIASGSGQHALHLSTGLPHVTWQPTEVDTDALASIETHRGDAAHDRVLAPRHLDVRERPWGIEADAVLACNLIHITPWDVTESLFAGAAETLPPGGLLATYGPYRFAEQPFAPSNAAFDERLRARNPAWGVRAAEDLDALAAEHGLARTRTIEMPANNHLLVWTRR